jgi:hypothetical protein
MSNMHAPVPLRFRAPSKYIIQCPGRSLGGGRGHLDFCPLRHKVYEDLRLDHLLGPKLDFEFSKLDGPLDDWLLASWLRMISPSGNDDGNMIL